jgi:hypothetical protein
MSYMRMFRALPVLLASVGLVIACSAAPEAATATSGRVCVAGSHPACNCPNSLDTGRAECIDNRLTECVCSESAPPSGDGSLNRTDLGDPGTAKEPGAAETDGGATPGSGNGMPKPTTLANDKCETHIAAGNTQAIAITTATFLYSYNANPALRYHDDIARACGTLTPGPDGVASFQAMEDGKLVVSLGKPGSRRTDPGLGFAVLSLKKGADCASAKDVACQLMKLDSDKISYPVKKGELVFVHWDFTEKNAGELILSVDLIK